MRSLKLNLGCGDNIINGWANHDTQIDGFDVRNRLPYRDNTVEFILAEHLLEHLTPTEVLNFLDECMRVLKPGGVLRVAVPCLDKIQKLPGSYEMFLSLLLQGPEGAKIKERRDSIEKVITGWNHCTWWTTELLKIVLDTARFKEITEKQYGESDHEELQNIDGHATTHWMNQYYPEVTDVLKREVATMEAQKE